ncbi:hypothetical protein GTY81_01945 [Streptomyces sp. SID8366]|uniref:DUF6777 domain-containing protein n=2 Tax=Streptomyces TaxID=1883 RepID=UPI000DC30E1C|nr:DUF6777 domain-containing protein [Streptomyces sp. PsTaAH-130]MYU02680.1 hypothetical protein [Streptomyces sp. SID8366]RAJ55584.1 hypothetical protein K376_04555 [Streptomyces sp. PsTaAH-130]
MRIPTGSMVMACVLLSVALLLTGCAGAAVKEAQLGEEVFLQPAAERGPNPFTASTATGPARTGTPRPTGTGRTADASAPPAGLAVAPLAAARALSGGTPGLYSGSVRVAGCDVERQIGGLTADPARGDAFAHVAGVSRTDLPGYLRALTPVLLRADTRVTNHGYRDGRTTGYQAVLQAGTAVLVDDRGVPRVRCACGNPLRPPQEARGGVGARGTAWSGYRPNQVIVVTPAPQAVGSLTLLDAGTNTWIERRLGPDVRNDHLVAPPAVADTAPPDPGLTGFPHPSRPDTGRPSPEGSRSNTATGEIGGAVIDTGRVAPGRGEGRGERADDRRTRANGTDTGERGTGVLERGAADRGESRSDMGTRSAGERAETGSRSAEGRADTGSRSTGGGTEAGSRSAGGRAESGSRGAASADGRGTHVTDERVTTAPDARGTSDATRDVTRTGDASSAPASTSDGTRAADGSGVPAASGRVTPTSDAARAPAVTGDAARKVGTSAASAATGQGTRAADASGAPVATGQGTGTSDASGVPAATGRVTPTSDAARSPAVTGDAARKAGASVAPAKTGQGTRAADASSAPASTGTGQGTRAVDASSAPAVTGHGTPAADVRHASASPGRSTVAPVASPETRAVPPVSAVPSASAAPPEASEPAPSTVPSAAPSLLDPLAYPPDTSLYNSAPFGDSLMPQGPDEIGPPNVTDTPALPDPSGGAGGAVPTPAHVLGG